MGIKPDADTIHFSAHPDERRLALALEECFEVTFGQQFSEMSFWLAQPKNNARERFGLQQEVLVIYSPHPKTDARVLTAIENISRNPGFRHRIDRVLILLVHCGDPVATADLMRNQESWVIACLHADALLNPHRGSLFLRSRLSAAVGDVDLFGMSSPIRSDKYLFGREDVINGLVQRCVTKRENCGLFGLRKTGKTSVLFALQRRMSERRILCEYIDSQNPGIHAARWWQVLENMACRLQKSLKTVQKRDCTVSGAYTPTNAGTLFSSDLREVASKGDLEQILLMFDEVEYITPSLSGSLGKHWDEDFLPFWQTMRAAHQETQGLFTFALAGVNPAAVERSHFGHLPNPIFQLANPIYLEPLSVSTVREMVRSIGRYSGLVFEEDVYGYLQQRYGGHPFLIRIACSEVWRSIDTKDPEKLTKLDTSAFASSADRIKRRLAQPIKDILLSLVWWYPDEYDLLQMLAAGESQFVADYLREKPAAAMQFSKYGLLKAKSDGFAIEDLQEFLVAYGETYKKEISPFTRGDMPPELLPAVPDIGRLGELFKKRTEIELLLRRVIGLYLGVKNNWDSGRISGDMLKGLSKRADRPDPSAIFVGRRPQDVMNDLYTLDLKSIIIANWEVFASLFDGNRARFEMNMDTLNVARRVDAHAKPVTDAEVEDFSNSYGWLHFRLARVPG